MKENKGLTEIGKTLRNAEILLDHEIEALADYIRNGNDIKWFFDDIGMIRLMISSVMKDSDQRQRKKILRLMKKINDMEYVIGTLSEEGYDVSEKG